MDEEPQSQNEEDKEIRSARKAKRYRARPTPAMEKAVENHKAASKKAGEKWKGN